MAGRRRYLALVPGAIVVPLVVVLGADLVRREPEGGLWIAVYLCWYGAGAVAYVRLAGSRVARRLLVVGTAMLVWGAVGFSVARMVRAGHDPTWVGVSAVAALDLVVPASVLALLAIYPNGEYGRPWERRVVRAGWASVVLVPLALLLTRPELPRPTFMVWLEKGYVEDWPVVASPIDSGFLHGLSDTAGALAPLTFNFALVFALVVFGVRYRRAEPADRARMAWPLSMGVAGALLGSFEILFFLGGVSLSPIGWLNALCILALPAFVAIGLLRPELFDIQKAMRRSLVYGTIWLAAGAVYIGATAAIGIAASARPELAVALTIIATLLLGPAWRVMRRRVRGLVFGSRLSRDELLRRFGSTLEHTLEPAELTDAVAATVHEALGVSWVRIRVDGNVVTAYGIERGDERVQSTSASLGNDLGSIECGPRVHGRWNDADRELLAALGRQTGLALRNARLAAELRKQAESLAASRSRIVAAAEDARRGIERDIHDGVQQELVALIARLALARNQLARDPSLVEETLIEVQTEAAQALDDLRELARGIHPSVLTDRGLVDAIEARASRLPLGVTLECEPGMRGRRFPGAVESAVYFLVSEGFANALKHSQAERVIVRLETPGDELAVEVIDDGVGFDVDAARLGGLQGLSDRLDAIGGSMTVDSTPGAGTRIRARVRVEEGARV